MQVATTSSSGGTLWCWELARARNFSEIQLLFDQERHHYQVLNLGWKGQKRIYGVLIHVDLKDGKIGIQRDGTEIGIANQLMAAGVPQEDTAN